MCLENGECSTTQQTIAQNLTKLWQELSSIPDINIRATQLEATTKQELGMLTVVNSLSMVVIKSVFHLQSAADSYSSHMKTVNDVKCKLQ